MDFPVGGMDIHFCNFTCIQALHDFLNVVFVPSYISSPLALDTLFQFHKINLLLHYQDHYEIISGLVYADCLYEFVLSLT